MDIKSFKSRFDPILLEFFDSKLQQTQRYTPNSFVQSMLVHCRKLVAEGGKRVRPYAAYSMYQTAGGKSEATALRYLVSLELFHIFCLIHDDIIDNGQERRGIPTLHVIAETLLPETTRDRTAVARSQALLVGDLMFDWAASCTTAKYDFASENLAQAHDHFATMMDQVILGQMLDVDLTTRLQADAKEINQKMLLKTASYTFIQPMRIGLALAGSSRTLDAFCHHYGEAMGLAFQIQDDLLDVTLNSQSGKSGFRDIAEGQHTLLTHALQTHGTSEQQSLLNQLWGTVTTKEEQARLFNALHDSGAIDKAKDQYRELLDAARAAVGTAKLEQSASSTWLDLVDQLDKRIQ